MSSWPWRRQSLYWGTLSLLLAVAACSGSGSEPAIPAEITLSSTEVTLAAAGQNLQLTATVIAEDGDPIPDAPVTWESADAGVVTVSGTGLLIGQSPGTAEVTATVGEITASAAVIVGSTASLEVLEGSGQTAAAGAAVPTPPAVRVRNASGTPVSGVVVRFQAAAGSGTATGPIQTTGADGIARVGAWQLGAAGVNTLTAAVDGAVLEGEPVEFLATTAPASGYDITVRYLTDLTTAQFRAFGEAEVRWESLVTGDLPDVNQTLPANQCGDNPETPGPFDDLTIFVVLRTIDGPGAVLGQAGPCFVRSPGDLTVIGRMEFDVEDMEMLEDEGSLQAVILHEMGHVLGFGTLWIDPFNLLVDTTDSDPAIEDTHFTGAQAIAAFDAAGGTAYGGLKVPVENDFGPGTRNSHWRDEVFETELMTGFLSIGFNPLSAVSVRSLQDLGYTVNVAGADQFTLNLPTVRVAGPRRGRPILNDIISDPIRRITPSGRVVGVLRR